MSSPIKRKADGGSSALGASKRRRDSTRADTGETSPTDDTRRFDNIVKNALDASAAEELAASMKDITIGDCKEAFSSWDFQQSCDAQLKSVVELVDKVLFHHNNHDAYSTIVAQKRRNYRILCLLHYRLVQTLWFFG
jgi:metallophosphoesterase superfamily enzyme